MYDAVVTFVTKDPHAGYAEHKDVIITKVYRVEFENEQDFKGWLIDSSKSAGAINVEQLGASES